MPKKKMTRTTYRCNGVNPDKVKHEFTAEASFEVDEFVTCLAFSCQSRAQRIAEDGKEFEPAGPYKADTPVGR